MNSLIMLTCAIVCASTEAKQILDKNSAVQGLTMKPVVACFGLGIFLFVFAMASNNLAQKFCYLCIVVALLRNGGFLIDSVTVLKPAPKKLPNHVS